MPPVNKNMYKKRVGLTPEQTKQVRKMLKSHEKRAASKLRFIANPNSAMLCGNAYVFNPLAQIATGDTSANRTGAKIHLDQLEISGIIEPTSGAGAKNFRWLFLAWWDNAETVSSSGFTTVTNANVLQTLPVQGSVSSGQVTNLTFDEIQCTPVAYRKGVTDNKVSTIPSEYQFHWKYDFRGKTCQYQEDTSPSFMDGKNLYCAFVSDVSGGTINVTTCGTVSLNYQVKYHQ